MASANPPRKLPSPDWDDWLTRPRWSILEGAYLLLGIEPSLEYPPTRLTAQQRGVFDSIVSAAISGLGVDLPTDWTMAEGFGPGCRMMMMVVPGDLMDFAMDFALAAEFELPAPIAAKFSKLHRTTQATGLVDQASTLTRHAIVEIYTRIDSTQWRHLFERNQAVKACRSPLSAPGKPLYSCAKIERWLINNRYYTAAEIKAGITRTPNAPSYAVRTIRKR